MRIAVISDTHMPRGARRLPDACVERLRAADLVVHAGDVAAAAFLDELEALGPPVRAVRGNVDDAVLQAGGPRARREERLVARFPGCAAVVYGHSHLPQVGRWHGVWILNPGSPTERRRAPSRTMLELAVERGKVVPELVELGI
jgi:predicted phosphodiesterase